MTRLLERNTTIPTKTTSCFTACSTCVSIQLLEGELCLARENRLLGELKLEGLPAAESLVEVTLEIDANGILHVWASGSGQSCHMVITNDRPRWSASEVEHMVEEAELSCLDIASCSFCLLLYPNHLNPPYVRSRYRFDQQRLAADGFHNGKEQVIQQVHPDLERPTSACRSMASPLSHES